MEIKLSKIYSFGEKNSRVFMSFKAIYGWEEGMIGDVIQLNFNGLKKEAYLTVKAKNSGSALVMKKMIDIISTINFDHHDQGQNPLHIIEKLKEHMGLEYDREIVEEGLKEYMSG